MQTLVGLGTLLLLRAHAWWSTSAYEALGIGAVLALTLAWQLGFLVAAEWARRSRVVVLEAGFAAIVAFYTPLTAYTFERALGFGLRSRDFHDFYSPVSGGWVWMELAAIAVALLLLVRYRRPFLALPVTLFTGFLAIELDWLCDGRHALALFLAAALALALGVWLARTTHLAAGGILGWGALSISAHGAVFPFLLMAGGVGFVVRDLARARRQPASPVPRRAHASRTAARPRLLNPRARFR